MARGRGFQCKLQALFTACAYALMEMLAGYDARNPKALARLVAAGAQLVVFSLDILKAPHTALEQARRGGREKRAVQARARSSIFRGQRCSVRVVATCFAVLGSTPLLNRDNTF